MHEDFGNQVRNQLNVANKSGFSSTNLTVVTRFLLILYPIMEPDFSLHGVSES